MTTTLDTGQVSQVQYVYDQFNNQTDKYEYDWGKGGAGTLIRHTNTVYNTSSNYTALNILGLPQETKIENATGNALSDIQYSYDEYSNPATPIYNCPDVSGHDNGETTMPAIYVLFLRCPEPAHAKDIL